MPAKNKIIKLNSISRMNRDNRPCIVLDNQQDSLCHVHSLALVPVVERMKSDGSKEISLLNSELHLLNHSEIGVFPICFKLQPKTAYLVLGIVPQCVITEFTRQGHFQANGSSSSLNGSAADGKRDQQMAREWIATRKDWIQTNGILIYA